MRRPAPVAAAASVFVALGLAAACGSAAREPPPSGAEAEPTLVRGGAPGGHTEADVRFVREMIVHHAQALQMTALVPGRTRREDIRRLARRIEVSQRDEIARMRQWLADRAEPAAGADVSHARHGGGDRVREEDRRRAHAGMPGMLSAEQLDRLVRARGAAFDRLFLEYMIVHHQGALVMVGRLFETPGAGQETEIYMFASHVDAGQRAEIERMRRMLENGA